MRYYIRLAILLMAVLITGGCNKDSRYTEKETVKKTEESAKGNKYAEDKQSEMSVRPAADSKSATVDESPPEYVSETAINSDTVTDNQEKTVQKLKIHTACQTLIIILKGTE